MVACLAMSAEAPGRRALRRARRLAHGGLTFAGVVVVPYLHSAMAPVNTGALHVRCASLELVYSIDFVLELLHHDALLYN